MSPQNTQLSTSILSILFFCMEALASTKLTDKQACLEHKQRGPCLSYASELLEKKQWSEAMPVLKTLCQQGANQSCLELTEVYAISGDEKSALKLAKQLCAEKSAVSNKACLKVAHVAKKNGLNKTANHFYQKSCKQGLKEACGK